METIISRTHPPTRSLTSEEETRLVERAREGDTAAFDQLVRSHYERSYATAFHLVGNHEDAEDLAQECFVRAFRSLRWYRGRGVLQAWLRRILVHLARDRFRRRSRRPVAVRLSEATELSEAGGPAMQRGPLIELRGKELRLLVAEGLRRLPDHLRIPLVLRTLERLEYREVARATGVTAATSRTQVMKARRALERFLAPYLEGGDR
jgi:RNA polymerase sigma-70 factor, ECF subfamily